jgi:hypothetical protein
MKWLWLFLVGCTFQVPKVEVVLGDLSAPPDLATADLEDLAEPDLTAFADFALCQPGCSGSMLVTCSGPGQSCAYGCSTANGPHCNVFYPSGGAVQLVDVAPAGVLSIAIGGSVLVHTDSGQIEGGFMRAAGDGVLNGIYFRVNNGVGIFSFASLTVGAGVTLSFTGGNGVALVSASTLILAGKLDAQGDCLNGNPGPGGGAGGVAGQKGGGSGGGDPGRSSNDSAAGAAGAGFADHGGGGGDSSGGSSAPSGGNAYSGAILVAGSGGGGGVLGGGASASTPPPRGGGGGGAVQLVARGSVIIGAGGGVNAGGCGGGATVNNLGGAGGGSGGMILVEAPTIIGGGVLAANGGAGSGGDGAPQASPGPFGSTAAQGQNGGGAGGSGSTQLAGTAGSSAQYAGGGGGACGRIVLRNAVGSPVSGVISPSASPTPIDAH